MVQNRGIFRRNTRSRSARIGVHVGPEYADLAYALTVYVVQGASERFAIALTGTEGGRKRMASLESTYVTLSRAKEHVQVYTDNLAGWSADTRHSNAGQTAHDLLHQKSDHESDTGNRLLATASPLDKTALGRRVLAENGLEGETMARFIAAGKKYPSPYVALPAWTRHGKEAGALLTEIRIEDDGMRVVLSEESRLRGGEDAQFAGLQASRNGQTLIADDAQTALRLAQENPESGVVIRLHGEERLLNAARLTGGRITEHDEVARTVRSVAEAESAAKAEDPTTLPPDEQQKQAEAQEKAARDLAEQARQELLPAVSGAEGDKPDPLLSASNERRLRDGTDREIRELDEAVREAVAEGRESRQQVREQMQRTEREWVVMQVARFLQTGTVINGVAAFPTLVGYLPFSSASYGIPGLLMLAGALLVWQVRDTLRPALFAIWLLLVALLNARHGDVMILSGVILTLAVLFCPRAGTGFRTTPAGRTVVCASICHSSAVYWCSGQCSLTCLCLYMTPASP